MIFGSVEVIKTSENYHYIEWEMVDQHYPADDYLFNIYWSNNPTSLFTAILNSSISNTDLTIGSTHTIEWTSTNIADTDFVKIELSRDGKVTWETIVESTENDGEYDWVVDGDDSSNCYFRISSDDIYKDTYRFRIIIGDDSSVEIDGAIGPLSYTHERFQYDFNQNFYYKIRAVLKTDHSQTFDSNVVFAGNGSDGAHKTIQFNEQMLYNHYSGEPCQIYKRKTNGVRCTECWSPYRRQITKSQCNTCNGTGFVDGYYAPIDAQISTDSDPKKNEILHDGEDPTTIKRSRLSNYPIVRDKDLIVTTDDNKRYKVIHVETTKLPKLSASSNTLSKQNYVLSQIITMEEVTSSDREYAVGV
jgi:hypothetical protein